jgi:hypothetical protein
VSNPTLRLSRTGPPISNITGMRFGYLVAERVAEGRASGQIQWHCLCDCGERIIAVGGALRRGSKKSCGCQRKAMQSRARTTHGQTKTDVYGIWRNMLQRCQNPTSNGWEFYGARGITVCDRWKRFEDFQADMGPRPSPAHTLDRIDSDGHYEPDNCRWATHQQQAWNRRSTRMIEYDGETLPLSEWARRTGLTFTCLSGRIKRLGVEVAMEGAVRTSVRR